MSVNNKLHHAEPLCLCGAKAEAFGIRTSSAAEVSMHSLRFVLLCVACTLAAGPLVADETVSDQQLGFRLTVPDGFVPDPEKIQGKVVCAFHRPPAADQKVGTFILVSRLSGVLGREKIDPKTVTASNPQVTIVTEKWKEFDIEVFRVPEQAGELQLLTFNAQVPLKPEAVQVAVIGDGTKESDLRSVLRSVLGSLDGPTNWLNTEQRAGQLAEGITRLAITVGVVLVIAVGVIVVIAVVVWRAVRKSKLTRGLAEPDAAADRPRE
jgi:hypothetical protein